MIAELLSEYEVILGSQSPRRQNLLKGLDLDFKIEPINADESFDPDMKHEEVPEYLAAKKASQYPGNLNEKQILITADTVVILNGEILNKPVSKAESFEMLKALSANEHKVVTGVCIRSGNRSLCFKDETLVQFHELEDQEIQYYIDSYQPFDKAGSYGIQEWIGYIAIDSMKGCFYNVMGLPLPKLYRALKNFV